MRIVHYPPSGILPINDHAKVKILNLAYINSFIFYSSANRLSNDTQYSGILPVNAHVEVNILNLNYI